MYERNNKVMGLMDWSRRAKYKLG